MFAAVDFCNSQYSFTIQTLHSSSFNLLCHLVDWNIKVEECKTWTNQISDHRTYFLVMSKFGFTQETSCTKSDVEYGTPQVRKKHADAAVFSILSKFIFCHYGQTNSMTGSKHFVGKHLKGISVLRKKRIKASILSYALIFYPNCYYK